MLLNKVLISFISFICLCFLFVFLNSTHLFSIIEIDSIYIDLTEIPEDNEEIEQYENFIKINFDNDESYIALQRIASKYIDKKEWDSTIYIYKKYMDYLPKHFKKINKILNILQEKDENLIITNLGQEINTSGNEIGPKITPDGKILYFTGSNREDSTGLDDVYISYHINKIWQNTRNAGNPINTIKSESITGVSTDANELLLFGNYPHSLGRGDIFYINRNNNKWDSIIHLPESINTKYFECDASYAVSGNSILFVSDRPGGIGEFHKKDILYNGDLWGNTDIYITIKTDTGWSNPINLGNVINTPYAERTPFLHPDGKTLYFSSDGHYGLGHLDVFKSVRLRDDSWTEWSEPENLGKIINTSGDDWGYIVSTDGNLAYFNSNKITENFGEMDIYSISIPTKLRPDGVALLYGTITDSLNNPLDATVTLEDLSKSNYKNVGTIKNNPIDGKFFIPIPMKKNYHIFVEKKGYFPEVTELKLADKNDNIEINQHIILEPLSIMAEKGTVKYIFNLFKSGEFQFNPENYTEIKMLVNIINENPDYIVDIYAHTDSDGSEEFNMRLSQRRADAVKNYLIKRGCNSNNIIAKGYGEQFLITNNDTQENKARNRRLEFKLHFFK